MASQNFGCQLFEKLHECQNFLTKFVLFSDIQNKVEICIREMEDFKLFFTWLCNKLNKLTRNAQCGKCRLNFFFVYRKHFFVSCNFVNNMLWNSENARHWSINDKNYNTLLNNVFRTFVFGNLGHETIKNKVRYGLSLPLSVYCSAYFWL